MVPRAVAAKQQLLPNHVSEYTQIQYMCCLNYESCLGVDWQSERSQ